MKYGIVDVGGGYRGVYATGVMDYLMDRGIRFDVGVGVSAGSANLITYAAGQRGRCLKFYTEYGLRREYASFWNFLTKRSFIDLDYVYGTLSNAGGENPLDFAAAQRSGMEFVAVATNALTGQVEYFTFDDMRQDDYGPIKASCAIPFVCHPYEVAGVPYYDGALGDTIPVQKALDMGCEKVVLLLTLPIETIRTSERDERFARFIRRKYPRAAERLTGRARQYNEGVARAREMEKEGRLCIVAPDDTCGVTTLCRDAQALKKLYQKGYRDAEKIERFMG